MILAQVEITNYKQYGGHHIIDIPAAGAIGVIGANGVGKTTLFEAIEWALYSPSTIKQADVQPRVWRGKTEVKVTLDDPVSGRRFIVEREVGKGSAKARIYRVDHTGFEEKIVDGARQVTNYVAENLIGLEHSAFVATFFTRQKELGFFNGSKEDRRRQVFKLLGLESIREAQQIISEDRKRAKADARSYREQSEAQSEERDFTSEIAAAETGIAQANQKLETALSEVTAASAAVEVAGTALTKSEQVRDQDLELGQQISQAERSHGIASEQIRSATHELERLDKLTAERTQLLPVAEQLDARQKLANEFDQQRRAVQRQRELRQELAAMDRRDADLGEEIRNEIVSAPAPDKHASWSAQSPTDAADWAASLNLTAIEARTNGIAHAVELHQKVVEESARLESYLKRVEELRNSEHEILKQGDPAGQIQEIRTKLQEWNGSISAASSTSTRLRENLQKSQQLVNNLQHQHEGESCPTCARPFSAGDIPHAVALFQRDVNDITQQLQQIDKDVAATRTRIGEAQLHLEKLEASRQQLADIRGRIESGKSHVQEQQDKVDGLRSTLESTLESLGRREAPTTAERDEAQRDLLAWRRVTEAGLKVGRSLRTRNQIVEDRAPIVAELETLADVSYDEAAHRQVTEQLQESRTAVASITRMDAELARREQIEQSKSVAAKNVAESEASIKDLRSQQQQLGFDAAKHQQAQQELRSAQEREKIGTEQRHRADVELRDAKNKLLLIQNEKDRIANLAKQAEAKQREADDLDRMYSEFTEFERYASAWYTPRLNEIASELVTQVTEGKYDRIEFDGNFSIEVFDGDDEKYPYETFSGGERDAIALCARIALSRLIGGASSSPPGFLVLDEVFGSLDLERRQRLLEMLAAITNVDDHFRQVFIISHVDDVRTSPILDDVWRVSETEDGTSELQPLSVGVDIGEL